MQLIGIESNADWQSIMLVLLLSHIPIDKYISVFFIKNTHVVSIDDSPYFSAEKPVDGNFRERTNDYLMDSVQLTKQQNAVLETNSLIVFRQRPDRQGRTRGSNHHLVLFVSNTSYLRICDQNHAGSQRSV